MKAYHITKLRPIAELKSDNVYSRPVGIKFITLLQCCLFLSPDLVVLFIVLPHTHSKANTVLIGHKQVPPLHMNGKIC